jgi:hypothetical protein
MQFSANILVSVLEEGIFFVFNYVFTKNEGKAFSFSKANENTDKIINSQEQVRNPRWSKQERMTYQRKHE